MAVHDLDEEQNQFIQIYNVGRSRKSNAKIQPLTKLLLSCLLSIVGRRYLYRAIEYFLQQDYESKGLNIVRDSKDLAELGLKSDTVDVDLKKD